MEEEKLISGAGGGGKGGGGGGGRTAQEEPNSLRSAAVVRVVEVVSEGEIVGICGGARGIYLNDTPLLNGDGSYNFDRVGWDYRVGLPSQNYIPGFSSVEAVTVSSPVNFTTASAYTGPTASSNVDAARVTIRLPQGLYEQDTSNGDLKGTSVSYRIETKLTSSGSWINAQNFTITGKTTSAYERQHRIERPSGAGTWHFRVTRTTADPATAALRNQTAVANVTEIQDVKLPYNDTAYVGIAVDAESVGGTVPKRSYLVKGLKIKVPTNYNPLTRVYTGPWNGTFYVAWTDNTAWILYDLLTHPRYGLGEFISEGQVDKYSFYDAAVYNDGLVTNGKGSTEPRFTFNGVINSRSEALRLLQTVAGSMRAQLMYVNGVVTLLQDRPGSPVKLINKATVLDGKFTYRSTGLFERHTAFNVTFNDREDRHLQRVVTIDETTESGAFKTALENATNRYGYVPVDIAAFGATTEGQAMRHGRWALDTELNQTELVTFKMGLNGFDLMPYDIVKVYDEDYANVVGAGRIVSATYTTGLYTFVLDRPVTLTSGSTIEVTRPDTGALHTYTINQTSGTLTTITAAAASTQFIAEGSPFIVKTTVEPRQFRVMSIRQEEAGIVTVEALFHDPNKYARVEQNLVAPTPIFSNVYDTVVGNPTSLTVRETASVKDDVLYRGLLISWLAPTVGVPIHYSVKYRVNSGTWTLVSQVNAMAYEIERAQPGLYDIVVQSVAQTGAVSTGASTQYNLEIAAGSGSALLPPTTLVSAQSNDTNFYTQDLHFKWTNPAGQTAVTTATLKDFEVRILRSDNDAVIRTFYVEPVAAGAIQTARYLYADNMADSGNAPRRSLKVQVYCRDTNNKLSTAVTTTFTNSAPASVSGLAASGSFGAVHLRWAHNTEIDLVGYRVWRNIGSPSFITSSGNLVYDGDANTYTDGNVVDGNTYYYKVAAYDSFALSATDGAGLNVVTSSGAVTLSLASDNAYEVRAATWVPNYGQTVNGVGQPTGPATNVLRWYGGSGVNSSFELFKTAGAGSPFAWTIPAGQVTWTTGLIFVYFDEDRPLQLWTTTNLPEAVGARKVILATYRGNKDLEVGNGKAYMDGSYVLAGTIGAAQLVAGQAVITGSAQIGDNLIVGNHITAGSITTAKIAAGTVTADKIDSRNLTIKDGNGTVIFGVGTPLNLQGSYVTNPNPAWLNSNITLNANGTLSGAGGGQVNLAGLGYTGDFNATKNQVYYGEINPNDFAWPGQKDGDLYYRWVPPLNQAWWYSRINGYWYLSSTVGAELNPNGENAVRGQINTSNISTYIQSAVIGEAYIANAAITEAKIANAAISNAKIGYAAVDTIKIQGNAVTVPTGTSIGGKPNYRVYGAGTWDNLGSVVFYWGKPTWEGGDPNTWVEAIFIMANATMYPGLGGGTAQFTVWADQVAGNPPRPWYNEGGAPVVNWGQTITGGFATSNGTYIRRADTGWIGSMRFTLWGRVEYGSVNDWGVGPCSLIVWGAKK